MTDADKSVLVLAFEATPRVRILNYIDFLAEQGMSIDFVVWDADRWRNAEEGPGIPEGVRMHEIRPGERNLFTQRLKHLVMYRGPRGTLRLIKRLSARTPVTQPVVPAVTVAQKAHRRITKSMEWRIFRMYNRLGRPRRTAKVADRILEGAIDFSKVGRIVSTEPYSITYAYRLSKRMPGVPATITLDRSPLTPPEEHPDTTPTSA